MRVELTNGRNFIIKIAYKKLYKNTFGKDEFNREVITSWVEYDTIVTISEWFKNEPYQSTTVTGRAHCNYQDNFNKVIGKGLAYYRALQELYANGIINGAEQCELAEFELNKPVYISKKSYSNNPKHAKPSIDD